MADMIPTHGIDLTASLSPVPVLLMTVLVGAILLLGALVSRHGRAFAGPKRPRLGGRPRKLTMHAARTASAHAAAKTSPQRA